MGDDRVALVTGGTRGIGGAISTHLAESGLRVAAGYLRDTKSAESLKTTLTAKGHTISTYKGSVGVPEDCARVAQEVLAEYGRIDYLVNCAGINVDKTVRRMTIEDWHAVLRINLSGSFYMTKAVLEHMVERGSGRIVYISSVIGETGNIGQANYAASKSGLFGLTKTLALEMARRGITVNCVTPGFIDTDMLASVPKNVLDGIIARIPLQRLGKPSEVARLVRFLLDDEAGYITGAVIPVNGGLEM